MSHDFGRLLGGGGGASTCTPALDFGREASLLSLLSFPGVEGGPGRFSNGGGAILVVAAADVRRLAIIPWNFECAHDPLVVAGEAEATEDEEEGAPPGVFPPAEPSAFVLADGRSA